MRELKFRAWDKENEVYLDPDETFIIAGNGYHPATFSPTFGYTANENLVLEQFTGLKDKNGKEIYEGDIISFSIPHFDKSTLGYDGEIDLVGKVLFDYDRFGIEDKGGVRYDLYLAEEGEVIGNIHENKELLK